MAPETPPAPALDEVADELYGLAPEEFTAARTRHEKDARKAGDRELAAAIHGLAKPTVAAWLANQLVREHRDELAALAELGAGLRQATERLAADELRQLSRRQHQVVHALVQQARQLASDAGRPASEATAHGVEDTLYAAMADEQAASQLLAGQLAEPLQRGGFNEWAQAGGALSPKPSAPTADRKTSGKAKSTEADQALAEAKQALAEAEQALADATTARDDAKRRAADADQAAARAREKAEQLRQQLDEATATAHEADRRREEQATALERAERSLSDAADRRDDARERRDRQGGG